MFKILIAEDDRELRQLFQHVLLKNGYTVKGVSDGQEALDALEKDYYDLIISDIMMPNMDGYELVRSLRDAGDSIPVLMVTAKDAFDDMRMGFLSGTDDYMVKPVNINELVLRVGALLRRAQMINERKQRIGDTILECDSLTVSTASESMVLPQKEFMLLYKMVAFPAPVSPVRILSPGPNSTSVSSISARFFTCRCTNIRFLSVLLILSILFISG